MKFFQNGLWVQRIISLAWKESVLKTEGDSKKLEDMEAENGENGDEWKRRERGTRITGTVHTPCGGGQLTMQ